MDQPTNQNPATDDQELAKVLAGMNDEVGKLPTPTADTHAAGTAPSGLQFEETPTNDPTVPAEPPAAPAEPAENPAPEPAAAPAAPSDNPTPVIPPSASTDDLDDIKKDALEELRPLVEKLDLPADEKFDTMLLIIRSTDDKSLLAPAHEAAKAIADEQKRAAALLDIIKEIDYFSTQK